MNEKRLMALADALYNVPPEKFDLNGWRMFEGEDSDRDENTYSDERLLSASCGTTGCAVGWACALPAFRKQGLVWWNFAPMYKEYESGIDHEGWEAVEAFFDIDYENANYLFSSTRYETEQEHDPVAVAKRIEEFVKIGDEFVEDEVEG